MSGSGSPYDDAAFIAQQVDEGRHREIIGGLWDEIGPSQLSFLRAQGLGPDHRLLDIGCGSLRGGVHFVRYLTPGHYYGVDANQDLLDAGYNIEVAAVGATARLPREHLMCSRTFDFAKFETRFDFGLAFSVFTHLPLNDIRTCIENWEAVASPSARLYATYFLALGDGPLWRACEQPHGQVITYGDRDPFHYRLDDLAFVANSAGWQVRDVADYYHPRGQRMAVFERRV